ncbi:PIN domain-containing protein [Streptomyces ipomoeae]|uniref:Ribonuclease VapC n=2 Tax=Streptomyces ipomoeae TaxID=103232 RepID=L1KHG4_9ACTN|nr:type II toxin-antitoxin system VapC family toxin [Streptomyces ipomoeae]EKX60246.1 toxin-antitoxin system, toxin component, PIN family [Streptomyces ipomoeae 91-03]MDX2696514.1 type II toxin-antitoxin system VapC family toxin [Streptomyces ipomoeae]MDX2824852.1 type II toxin-antitoxin system VapC family toxin [Streptomyces ipomoeae]MDX2841163.1 type II toxin-antitoxin system VapC family toxin [Streptomyces ipomoeae]MDX2873129.1 type II toxin-antitoxin system VapC family toxin [Streptomyces 
MSETVVMDCSALVHFLTNHDPLGLAVRTRMVAADAVAVPTLIDYEIQSALLGMRRGDKLTAREVAKAVDAYRQLPLVRHETLPLWDRVQALHENLSAYDAQYVALAEALAATLITSDARIGRSGAAKCGIEVFGSN